MRRLFLTLTFLGFAGNASGQGFVTFNNIGSPIRSLVTGAPLGAGWTIELLVGDRLLASTPVVGGGTFLGPEPVDLGTADPVDVTVRGYPTQFGSWETAVGIPGAELVCPITFRAQGGNANAVPPEVPAPLGFPGGFSVCIPEPATSAMSVLGIVVLALVRRIGR